ncbi:MAG: nitrous oxide reductase accessory protein NosL [Flavobacteriaceae bacterium]|nr:nitrous oxide reductase accessory protein NosL [Flavobacteriaceae bacterium]
MKVTSYLFLASLFCLLACQVKQKEIHYGEDHCEFCQMTIVDKQHAAQLVTKKGKAHSFDAIECMIHYTKGINTSTVGLFLAGNYKVSENLINAKESYFIISENIPSPMGAFLSAVPTKAEAEAIVQEKGGAIYTWEELLVHLLANE